MKPQSQELQQIIQANTIRHVGVQIDGGSLPAKFPVKGQGTISIRVDDVATPHSFEIVLTPGSLTMVPCLSLTVAKDQVSLWMNTDTQRQLLKETSAQDIGLNAPNEAQPYWLSLDTNNARVRYGKGEMLRALMLFEYSWAGTGEPMCRKDTFSGDLQYVHVMHTRVQGVEILPIPINLDPSPHVVSPDAVTLELLSLNKVSVVQDLPAACQRLYANVSGKGISIQPEDFVEFPHAIQHSIITPGCICYKRLREKDPGFGYLRITIDQNLGDSPGQPYVLEIWPAGNGSPIHDHGQASAVIKVLWGCIDVSWYPALSPQILEPWGSVNLAVGDVTFLTSDYYQIHQLRNPFPAGSSFCATIQCYRYSSSDHTHKEYFDYIKDGEIMHFAPDSDWTYLEFKNLIRDEWRKSRVQID